MTDSQEQSLNEDIVFLPVTESAPNFLHSETERLALERLLNAGPEAFYSSVGAGQSSCFLSPDEVTDFTNWAQDYHVSSPPKENGEIGQALEIDDYCSTYYPAYSDTPPPSLTLGWPESSPWGHEDSVKVYTSPPAEGEPSVREIIRRKLQTATQVIAVVTDRLTDCAVIGDLHSAASRGVPVYIILNQRSAQENTLVRLRHPNIQMRVLGGKSFCSRAGRMLVGEMKDKFVLVDLQTVIHGSYSLTWSDAHLHRQLVTVITGSVVDSFDREFRILFAASSPVPEPRRSSCGQITNHLNNFSDAWVPKRLPFLDAEIINPPSPPADSLLDWEAMGVISGGCSVPNSPLELHDDVFSDDKPVLNNAMMDKKPKFVDNFFSNKHLLLDKKRFSEPPPPASPTGNYISYLFASQSKTQPKWKEPPSPEIKMEPRIEPAVEKTLARQISHEKPQFRDDKLMKRPEKEPEPPFNTNAFSHIKRRQDVKEPTVKEEPSSSNDGHVFKMENTPSSRKPVILRVPHTEDNSSLSDIMKRMKQKQSTQEPERERSNTTVPDVTRSMVDLSVHSTEQEDKVNPVPRFRASTLDVEMVTPALALMQKRNDYIRSALYRTPQAYQPRDRPRSFAFSNDWRKSLSGLETQDEDL